MVMDKNIVIYTPKLNFNCNLNSMKENKMKTSIYQHTTNGTRQSHVPKKFVF